jgi:RIO-like serine/threonine protein kinase
MAAIYDLLTSQCDRHAQNILVSDNGNIHLIDHEAALQVRGESCSESCSGVVLQKMAEYIVLGFKKWQNRSLIKNIYN